MYTLTIKTDNNKLEAIKIIRNINNAPVGEINKKIENNLPVLSLNELSIEDIQKLVNICNDLNKINVEFEIYDNKYKKIITYDMLTNRYNMFIEELTDPNALH